MNYKVLSIIVLAAFFLTCGKKDEAPQTQIEQQAPQQQTEQNQQQQTQTTTETEKQKEEEKLKTEKKEEEKLKSEKKEEEKKKKEEEKLKSEKKKEEEIKKKEEENKAGDIDFSVIWPKRCQKCHGSNLKGKVEGVPDLTRKETQSKSLKQLITIITNGVQAETEDGEDMPSFKKKLTEDEIKAAAKFVLDH